MTPLSKTLGVAAAAVALGGATRASGAKRSPSGSTH